MRTILPLLLLTSPAAAHTGHFAEAGGHDHWGLAIGLGVIAGAAAIGWVRGRKDRDAEAEAEAEEAEAEAEEAEAEAEEAVADAEEQTA